MHRPRHERHVHGRAQPRAARAMVSATLVALLALGSGAAQAAARVYLGLALSPDGQRLASVEGDAGASGGRPVVRQLMIRSTDGRHETVVALPCGAQPECWPSDPAWTPDGRQLSFALRSPGKHARSLWQVGADGRGLHRLLDFDGTIEDLRYGPDGSLAMLATAGATKEVGATEAGAPLTGDIATASPSQRLAVLAPGARQLQWVTRDGLFVYEYDWRPDARGFVGTAAPGDGDRNWWVAQLYAFDRAPGSAERVLYAPRNAGEQLAEPHVSPDGRRVSFIVGLMSDFGSTGGDLYTVPSAGGPALNLTPGLPASVTHADWRCDGRLLASVLAGDQAQRRDFGAGDAATPGQVMWQGVSSLGGITAACKAPVEAALIESWGQASEIHVGDGRSWKPLTKRNAGLQNAYTARSIRWQNEGLQLQGWLLMPPAKPGARLPLIVDVHGGPAAAFRPRFIDRGTMRSLLDRGYALFLPNPRGSFGQGAAFTRGNVQDFGGGDLRDILSGVDAVLKEAPVDGERLGITGHSYGGFMTMWTVTQTTRFKAAVAGAGIANWQSYYGQNGIAEWMTPYFGATVYADPAVYAKSSPINFITRVRTPTLAYVGEADIECPAAQTLEFGRALQTLGVPSSTVIYPGEGHGFRKPATLADIERRTLAWFDKYLAP